MACTFATRTVTQFPHCDHNAPCEVYCMVHGLPLLTPTTCAIGAIEEATAKAIKEIEKAKGGG